MITEIGHFALILALFVALVQAVFPLLGAARNDPVWMGFSRTGAVVQFLLVFVAFLALVHAYVTSDFSVANVVRNSHTGKPLFYKIAGVWSNHEGSLLLWILILSLSGMAVGLLGRTLAAPLLARTLSVQAMITVGFLLFILFTSNPFLRVADPPLNGRGLNPLLQDPGLVFHPPFLYLGYVGLSVVFSFAVAALIEGRVDVLWARWVRPWILAAWCFLTLGIGLGSLWAYYELGWGGWWYWDPVENASLVPWLVATALLHSIIVVEKRNALKSWSVLLAILAFSCSLLGTFIVRSGIITSVHAFAVDPRRGLFILVLLVLAIGGSLLLFAVRAPRLHDGGIFAPLSREGSLLANNIFMSVAAGTVLLGTLYPLMSEALGLGQISVGAPYFNRVFLPLMAPVAILSVVGPFLPWKRLKDAKTLRPLIAAFLLAAIAVLLVGLWSGFHPWWGGPGIGLAVWIAAGTLLDILRKPGLLRSPSLRAVPRLFRLRRRVWGMAAAHLGLACMIAGMTGSAGWSTETVRLLPVGGTTELAGYTYAFREARTVLGPNYTALQGTFRIERGGKDIAVLTPEKRTYTKPPLQTSEAAIHATLARDLYAIIGDRDESGGYVVRLYDKPLVMWLWIGGLLFVLGGALSLSDRRAASGLDCEKKDGNQ